MYKNNMIAYRMLRPVLSVVFKAFYNPTIIHKEYIPEKGVGAV